MKKLIICFSLIFLLSFSVHGQVIENITVNYQPDTLWSTDKAVPSSVIKAKKAYQERLINDPYRPAYHFNIPGWGVPGDPNGAFYHNGKYHLMYLYHREGIGFSWGHVSSKDLFHWRHHKDAILPTGKGEDGIFSGGAYVNENGSAVLSYWQFVDMGGGTTFEERTKQIGSSGIALTKSADKNFDEWEQSEANPVINSTQWGITEMKDDSGNKIHVGSSDPSNIWKKDGKYYMLTGNLLVLNEYGREPDDPASEKGDQLYLWSSEDMKNWEYEHRFYESKRKWTQADEDNMCPSFLPLPASENGKFLSDKHLLLFISHNKGAQYYIGDYEEDRFIPQEHGRMSWNDNAFFAPEALIDGQGRQIMWSWIFDDRPDSQKNYYGWTGTYSLPRSLWLGEDGTLKMKPVDEIKQLRLNEKTKSGLGIASNQEVKLNNIGTELMELQVSFKPNKAKEFGVKVAMSEDGDEETVISYDREENKLIMDTRNSGADYGRNIVEEAPLNVDPSESLELRIFVDHSIVEVFANNRQAISRRIYPKKNGTVISIFSNGGSVETQSIKAWEMMSSNPF